MSYKEKDIAHEAGRFWVLSKRDAYYVMRAGTVCSESLAAYNRDSVGLGLAVAYCNYLAKRDAEKVEQSK